MRNALRTFGIAAASLAVAAAWVAPAYAGGRGHGRGHGYDHGYYDGWCYDRHRGYWRDGGRHHYRYHRKHRGGLSGAEAGLIAAGIAGAAILIDSANDRRYDDRYHGRRRYDDRYYNRRRYDDRYYDRYGDDDFYYRRDGGVVSDRDWDDLYDDDINSRLAGADAYNYGAAYNDCKAETREAARDRGLAVGLPARPERIERIEGGSAVRFVTSFTADGRRQTMVCEADEGGVRFLELV
jgi:hypothetical protein